MNAGSTPIRVRAAARLLAVNGRSISAFWRMASEEPFRVFFPLGLIVGIIGLSLWPLHFLGWMKTYPALMHARLMVEGFMAAFVLGFLGTAAPRLLDAPHFKGLELAGLLALYSATVGAHLGGWVLAGDAAFLALLLGFIAVLGMRFARAKELPPPNFVLVAGGMLIAVFGAGLDISATALGNVRLYFLSQLFINQGFVLLPLLGVGQFLFPRFLGQRFDEDLSDLKRPTPKWTRKAMFSAGTGLCIALSYVVESAGYPRSAGAVRFASAAIYLLVGTPAVLRFGPAPMAGQFIRVSMWLLLAGSIWPVFLPGQRIAGLHLLFIGGFMLATFTVGTRVILGHSGQGALTNRRLPFLATAAGLILLGLVARVAADFMDPVARRVHLIHAALLCLLGAAVWGTRLIPRVFIPDAASHPAACSGKCGPLHLAGKQQPINQEQNHRTDH
jgi:uncharacterized protein involved in response to NO